MTGMARIGRSSLGGMGASHSYRDASSSQDIRLLEVCCYRLHGSIPHSLRAWRYSQDGPASQVASPSWKGVQWSYWTIRCVPESIGDPHYSKAAYCSQALEVLQGSYPILLQGRLPFKNFWLIRRKCSWVTGVHANLLQGVCTDSGEKWRQLGEGTVDQGILDGSFLALGNVKPNSMCCQYYDKFTQSMGSCHAWKPYLVPEEVYQRHGGPDPCRVIK